MIITKLCGNGFLVQGCDIQVENTQTVPFSVLRRVDTAVRDTELGAQVMAKTSRGLPLMETIYDKVRDRSTVNGRGVAWA